MLAEPAQQGVYLDRDLAVGAGRLVELGLVVDSRHPTMMPDAAARRGNARPGPGQSGPGRTDGARWRALAARSGLRQTVGMMTESQALETLAREDPEAADDARAALAWLTGDEGLETISLLRLQEFLWYALPVKWPMSTPGRVGVAKALGRLFLLADR